MRQFVSCVDHCVDRTIASNTITCKKMSANEELAHRTITFIVCFSSFYLGLASSPHVIYRDAPASRPCIRLWLMAPRARL